jgi:Integrase core domain
LIGFGNRCKEAGVRPSYGSVGDAYDNATCESCFTILERELIDRSRFRLCSEARIVVIHFIKGFYNEVRPHSLLGYMTLAALVASITANAAPATGRTAAVCGASALPRRSTAPSGANTEGRDATWYVVRLRHI